MTNEFAVGKRKVGPRHPPLVIAEVGINHEGQFRKAVALIDAAKRAGAEVVKFQCHITEKEMIPTDMRPGKISKERLWDIIKRCELTEAEERKLQAYCGTLGMIYLSTPFSREAADRLHAMKVPAFKIGSGECNNYPLLDHIARMGKPMILSTGMNDVKAVRKAVTTISRHGTPVALMHCTSMYPTPYEKVRLGAVSHLAREFPRSVIGLSDHSMGIWTCLGAVAVGADILEKHFTISRGWPGPDTRISIEPDELADLITGSRAVWRARGGAKTILSEEKPVIDFAYATVVSIAPVRRGDRFSHRNVWVKRPGVGPIKAEALPRILGKRALRDIPADEHLRPADVAGYRPLSRN